MHSRLRFSLQHSPPPHPPILQTGKSYRSVAVSEYMKLHVASRVMATPGGQPDAEPYDAGRLPFIMRNEIDLHSSGQLALPEAP